jgi:tRNA pseudouridine38-40 synthase
MSRYFIEVSYLGTRYAGFQVQENAVSVQEKVEKAVGIFLRREVGLTGSSRTDTGVHARQNFFHADIEEGFEERNIYNINSLLPDDIAIRSIRKVAVGAHCRFDAVAREYAYRVYAKKDPFIMDRSYYFPYKVDLGLMNEVAEAVKGYENFVSFAKRNSQVKTFECHIMESKWIREEGELMYRVKANRFLRGMVRGLVGTMLQVGRGRINVKAFRKIVEDGDSSKVDFSVPGHGLCLEKVEYAEGYFDLGK